MALQHAYSAYTATRLLELPNKPCTYCVFLWALIDKF